MEEKELLKKAKNNDNNAIDELSKKYNSLISSIVRRYFLVGGDTEDLMQEAMIGFWNAINSYNLNETATFKTFLTLCVTRKIQSAIRSANSQKHKPLNDSVPVDKPNSNTDEEFETDPYCYFILPEQRSPEENFIEQEQEKNLKVKIKSLLSPFQLQVLNAYLEGRTYSEIAQKFNKSNKDIDNTLMSIKKTLSNLKNEEL